MNRRLSFSVLFMRESICDLVVQDPTRSMHTFFRKRSKLQPTMLESTLDLDFEIELVGLMGKHREKGLRLVITATAYRAERLADVNR